MLFLWCLSPNMHRNQSISFNATNRLAKFNEQKFSVSSLQTVSLLQVDSQFDV